VSIITHIGNVAGPDGRQTSRLAQEDVSDEVRVSIQVDRGLFRHVLAKALDELPHVPDSTQNSE
jgi:hypothetical protein